MAEYSEVINLIFNLNIQNREKIQSLISSMDQLRRSAQATGEAMQRAFKSGSVDKWGKGIGASLKGANGEKLLAEEYSQQTFQSMQQMDKGMPSFLKELGVGYIGGATGAKKLGGAQRILNSVMAANKRNIQHAHQGMQKYTDSLGGGAKNAKIMQRAMLMFGLSTMFAGMALMRYTQTAIKAIGLTYKTATGEQGEFAQGMNKLSAAMEFMKFSLMDALMQSGLFAVLVEWVIKLVNWFAKLPQSVRTMIMIGLIFGLILGTLMMVVGQTLLFANGVIGLTSSMAEMGTKGNASLWKIIWSMIQMVLVIVVIIALIYFLYQLWSDPDTSQFDKIIGTLMMVAFAVALIALLFGFWMVAAIAAIVGLVALIVFFRKELWANIKAIGLFVWNWLQWMHARWELSWALIGLAIQDAIWTALVWVASKFDSFINGLVKMANSKLPKAFQISWESNLEDKMSKAKDSVLGVSDKYISGLRANVGKNYLETLAASEMGTSAHNSFMDKLKGLGGGGINKDNILDSVSSGLTFDGILEKNNEQVEEQIKTNELMEENNALLKESLNQSTSVQINGLNSEEHQEKLWELYNGSTTSS